MGKVSLITFALASACFAAEWQANADRGPTVLKEQGCTNCHAIGKSGTTVTATALSRALNREYTPAGLTATLWNHAPQMWSAMAAKGMKTPSLSEQESADVFAYFASLRYFEQMGESSRGAQLFRSKRCVECHAVAGRGSGAALPVTEWDTVGDPLGLVGKMWNHIPQMRTEMAKRKIGWPSLTPQELSDIMVYVRGLREVKGALRTTQFDLPPAEGGESLVQAHGCATCHKGELSFDRRIGDRTLTDIAAAMWNHGRQMVQNPATIPPQEMRKLIGWVWGRQFVHPAGSAGAGRRVAESKKCVTCHEGGGSAPAFASLGAPYSVVRMTSALWKHGPAMLEQMKAKNVAWPRMTPSDVENLIAWIDVQSRARK